MKTPDAGFVEQAADEEEEYAYVRHKAIPLNQLKEQTSRGSLIPDHCFNFRDVSIVDDDEDDPYQINADNEKRCYLNSKRLMFYFSNQFQSELARKIGKGRLTSSAKVLPPAILCREEVEGTFREAKWHFVPTIEVGSSLSVSVSPAGQPLAR